jgi:hypothetical protein
VAAYRSSRADGVLLAVGIFAAMLALAECVGVIVLVNRAGIAGALGVTEGTTTWVRLAAILAMIVVVTSVLVGVTPRRSDP